VRADVIRADLERQLMDDDTLLLARERMCSWDVSEVDFARLLEIDRARRELGWDGYREPREAAA
jgi:hypothetical protein